MAKDEKRVIIPIININHNSSDSGLVIQVDLAGATKESVDLEMGNMGFCIKAEAEDFRFENCFTLAHEVAGKDAKAKYASGLLTINVPFKDRLHGHRVAIE